jgi:hypothetical protein
MQYYLICVLIGALMGFVSGLIGVGGGIIAVPSMIYLLSMNTRDAIGTSLAVVVLVAISGCFKHFQNNHVDLKAALPMALGGIAFAYLGAWLSHRIDPLWLKRTFAIGIMLLSIKMLIETYQKGEPATPAATTAEAK